MSGRAWMGRGFFPYYHPPPEGALSVLLMPVLFQKMAPFPRGRGWSQAIFPPGPPSSLGAGGGRGPRGKGGVGAPLACPCPGVAPP